MVVIKAHHQCRDAAPRHPRATQHQPWLERSFPQSEGRNAALRNPLECAVDLDVVPGRESRKAKYRKASPKPPKAWCSAVGPRNHPKPCSTHIDATHMFRRHMLNPTFSFIFFRFPTSPRCWKLPSPATRPRSKLWHVKASEFQVSHHFTSVSIDAIDIHRLSWVPGYLNVSFPLSAVLAAHIATSCSTSKRSTELLNPMIQNFQLCEKARLHGLHACCELCILQVLLIWTCKYCIPTNLEHRIALSLSHLAHHQCLCGALLHPPGRQNPP